ncbi:MAG: DegQ family serine endoprotease [Betaproteobacteria bacterium]|nr:DegQ family serine endoprotease [Betaproteobacteria bacterium]
MKKNLIVAALALALGLVACLPEDGAVLSKAHADNAPATPVAPIQRGLPDFADLVEKVSPAVVNISVDQTIRADDDDSNPFAGDPFFDFLRRFGVPGPGPGFPPNHPSVPRTRQGIGSGFIVSNDGYVLTNAHVVGDSKAEVTVKLSDKREFKAKVIGIDRRTDVAVVKINAGNLPTVVIGNPDSARVGEWVAAIGSPFGFEHSVTAGIISAKARRLPDENFVPFIQTDVAINPGNSGGPLFDLSGRVIGINSQIYSRSGGFMGISFAIPIDVAMKVKNQLVQHGRVQRGRLGVYIQSVDPELASSFGLNAPRGALVAQVEPNGAAARAGLKPGDIVLKVDGKEVNESNELPRLIGDKQPGSKIKLEIWREGKSREAVAVLDEMPQEETAQSPSGQDKGSRDKLGLSLRPLNAREAAHFGVTGGVVVETASGQAARVGLRSGDVILSLNNQLVTSPAQFRQLAEKAGKRFALLIQRGDARLFVPFKLD